MYITKGKAEKVKERFGKLYDWTITDIYLAYAIKGKQLGSYVKFEQNLLISSVKLHQMYV